MLVPNRQLELQGGCQRGGCGGRVNFLLFAEDEMGGMELLLKDTEFTRAYAAKRLQHEGNPLQGRACTSEWLLAGDCLRPCTMIQDILGRQQAGTTAALQRGLDQPQRH